MPGLDEAETGIKIAGGNIKNQRGTKEPLDESESGM